MKIKKTRILFVAPLPPPVHGSAVVSKQIKDSKLINDTFCCDWVNMSTSRRMDEVGKITLSKPLRLFASLCKLIWLLLINRYDLCYLAITCHGKPFLKDAPFVLLCKLFYNKIVIHQHNKGLSEDVEKWPYRRLMPLIYKNTKIILLSWHLYPDIEKVVKKENVFICPNGINVNECLKDNKDKSIIGGYEKRVPRLLFLSNLIGSKGVIVLLDALKILKDQGVQFYCDFVGGETKEIDAKRFNEEVEKRGLDEIALYHGRKYEEEKELFFSKSDVFVFPSYEDCFPLVLLEAMAHRLPIITTNEGGIPDIVVNGKNGIICERKNPESLANCITVLLNDKNLCRKMGDEGYRILKERFTEELFEEKMLEILNTCQGTSL